MAHYTPKRLGGDKKSPSPTGRNISIKPNESISVRPIENGYIVSKSGYKGDGKNQQYYNKEYHSPTNPLKLSGKK